MTNSVRKGKMFEREIVRRLRAAGIECHRNLSQTRSAKQEGCDIEGTPWWLELCHAKTASPEKKFSQALHDQNGSRDVRPIVVIWKRDGFRETQATMSLDVLLALDRGDVDADECGPLVTLDLEDAIDMMKLVEVTRG